MAAAMESTEAKSGPHFDLPFVHPWLPWETREAIFEKTRVSASVRYRTNWGTFGLVCVGPANRVDEALALARQGIVEYNGSDPHHGHETDDNRDFHEKQAHSLGQGRKKPKIHAAPTPVPQMVAPPVQQQMMANAFGNAMQMPVLAPVQIPGHWPPMMAIPMMMPWPMMPQPTPSSSSSTSSTPPTPASVVPSSEDRKEKQRNNRAAEIAAKKKQTMGKTTTTNEEVEGNAKKEKNDEPKPKTSRSMKLEGEPMFVDVGGGGPSGDSDDIPQRKMPRRKQALATPQPVRLVARRRDIGTQYVILSTIGWREQGCRYHHDFDELISCKGGVMEKFMAHADGGAIQQCVYDCRPLKGNVKKSFLSHIGFNNVFLESVNRHDEFPDMCKHAKRAFEESKKCRSTHRFLFVCTAGCHRSVAVCLVMQKYFEMMGCVVFVEHISSPSWETRGLCSSCSLCRQGPNKDKILDDAMKHFD